MNINKFGLFKDFWIIFVICLFKNEKLNVIKIDCFFLSL